MQLFNDPFFKVLSKSDSGDNRNHISGILVPIESRSYFPPLRPLQIDGQPDGVILNAELILENGERKTTCCRYSMQHGKRLNGETRLTRGLEPLRHSSHADDILLVERSVGAPATLRLQLLRKGTPEHAQAWIEAAGRRSGVLTGWSGRTWHYAGEENDQGDAGFYRYRTLAEERTMIARLDRIDPIGNGKELSWEFDAIDDAGDDDDLKRAFNDPEIRQPFALLRIPASPEQITREVGFDLVAGSWVQIVIEPGRTRRNLKVEVAQLAPNGYTDQLVGGLGLMRLLARPDEPFGPPSEIGASTPPSTRRAAKVRSLSRLPKEASASAANVKVALQPLQSASSVQVRDVGQASFVTILDADGAQLAHFDAGWPISFNGHTAPAIYPVADPAPVILSHWDWDHLHAWFCVPSLQTVSWIVPRQPIGPGAAKMANALDEHGLLKIYAGSGVSIGPADLLRCGGHSGVNDTGLALSLELQDKRRVLMVGDSEYQHLPVTSSHDALVVTHHGAAFGGDVPKPRSQSSPAVVSVGLKNVYRHPREEAITAHEKAGWTPTMTSKDGRVARGDRLLP